MADRHKRSPVFTKETEATLRELLPREDSPKVIRGLRTAVKAARRSGEGNRTNGPPRRRVKRSWAVEAVFRMVKLQDALVPLKGFFTLYDPHYESQVRKIDTLLRALDECESSLREAREEVPRPPRGPKRREFEHALTFFTACSLMENGITVSKKRGNLFESVLRAIWNDATGGCRPPEDLWHFMKPGVDLAREFATLRGVLKQQP